MTPAFSRISPNLYNDGHDAPCVTGAPGGLAQADAFLSQWVPKIMGAPAYRDGGLIVITFDEGSDSAAYCGENPGVSPSHPSVLLPGKNGPGGGRVGAVLLSPLLRPGTVSTLDYNHYSLLRTIEDIFGLRTSVTRPGRRSDPSARTFSATYAEPAAAATTHQQIQHPARHNPPSAYADDAVVHCATRRQAEVVLAAISAQMEQVDRRCTQPRPGESGKRDRPPFLARRSTPLPGPTE